MEETEASGMDLLVKWKTGAGHGGKRMMGISEGVLPSFIRDMTVPGARGLLRVIYLYGPRAEGKYTYSRGRGLRGEVKPKRGR